jgi:predicted RNA-binding protein associated with RNAse of E/G family
MDYYLDVVDAELRFQLNFLKKMDYFLDVVSQVLLVHPLLMLYLQ